MSASPDWMQQLLSGVNNSMYSPSMGLAMGLLQAGGPSRMPTSLGQALGAGMQSGQQFQQAGLQNAMQQLMLGQTQQKLAYIQNMLGGGQQSNAPQGAHNQSPDQSQPPPMNWQTPNLSAGTPAMQNTLAQQNVSQQAQANGIPAQNNDSQLSAALQTPRGQQIAAQQQQQHGGLFNTLMNDPDYKQAMAAEWAVPGWGKPVMDTIADRYKYQNVRQGGAIYDPTTGQPIFQNPRLPEGVTLTPQGGAAPVPGALNSIVQSEAAKGTGELFGKTENVVDPTGKQTLTTAGQAIYGGLPWMGQSKGQGAGNVTGLPPSVTAGMAVTGKQATDSANAALEKQPSFQTQIPQINQLAADLDALNTGPGKETQIKVAQDAAAVAHFFGLPVPDKSQLTDAATARKTIVNMVAPMVRSMGAREPYQMVTFIRDGMASIGNTPEANQVILGMLRGVAEYGSATGQFAGNFLKQNNGAGFVPGQGAWNANWQSKADPGAYIFENLPEFMQQKIIGQAAKNPTINLELQRAQNSARWLVQNGYMRNPELMGDEDE